MFVPLRVTEFLERAATVYPDRVGIVDEPDQPAEPLGELTYRQVWDRARAQAAGLDALGIGPGERVAVVSHNSARLLTSFFGVCGWGRALVPVNFRLNAEEVAYIVEHAGASLLLVDPELDDELAGVTAPRRGRWKTATWRSSPAAAASRAKRTSAIANCTSNSRSPWKRRQTS